MSNSRLTINECRSFAERFSNECVKETLGKLHHSLIVIHLFDIQGVRVEGLEPPCLTAPDPKSGTSTNFATPAGFF